MEVKGHFSEKRRKVDYFKHLEKLKNTFKDLPLGRKCTF